MDGWMVGWLDPAFTTWWENLNPTIKSQADIIPAVPMFFSTKTCKHWLTARPNIYINLIIWALKFGPMRMYVFFYIWPIRTFRSFFSFKYESKWTRKRKIIGRDLRAGKNVAFVLIRVWTVIEINHFNIGQRQMSRKFKLLQLEPIQNWWNLNLHPTHKHHFHRHLFLRSTRAENKLSFVSFVIP